ncbi:Hsp33 family molecular chaperone HslO [uncultured Desulfosarcina sp.]|uniref:Hsp33 family molecular chaperone HslO n=1 Tax=uncultured Desulfosarcina sp. TaxID=218289 RepID=UPI0029C9A6E5|nr:Hsp33 family molecular chaperone HslO [uncultured Desulfosarcina sp.]
MKNESNRPTGVLDPEGKDALHTFLMADDTIRGSVVNGTRMIRRMQRKHQLGILETLILGHAYLGACLMSAGLKGKDRLQLQVDCSGPVKGLVVEANADGEVRGFLKNVPIPVDNPLEDFNMAPFIGAGFLSVTRTLEDAKQPFSGRVMLAHGRLAKDLAHYYLTSEQIPTSFSLSVNFDSRGAVDAAGGLFLQVMPGADDGVVGRIEDRVTDLPSIGIAFSKGIAPTHFVGEHLGEYAPRFIDCREVGFVCHCSRDQIRSVLTMLPMDELQDIQAKGPFPLEIRCHHCNTRYRFEQEHIDRIVAARFAEN